MSVAVKSGIHSQPFFIFQGGFDMSKEPMNTAALPEVPRRRRRIDSQVSKGNISYQELLGIHLRQCRIKNLATVTIDGYRTASRYFLDFAGNDLMCGDITQSANVIWQPF